MNNKKSLLQNLPGMLREIQYRRRCSPVEPMAENGGEKTGLARLNIKNTVSAKTAKQHEKPPTLKKRFLNAVKSGELGTLDQRGYIVTIEEFKHCFSDITTQYISSFLPEATIEKGRTAATNRKFLFRLSKGIYLVHPDVLISFEP